MTENPPPPKPGFLRRLKSEWKDEKQKGLLITTLGLAAIAIGLEIATIISLGSALFDK